MNRVDGVILGVGVVVLVASIIGVVLYDDTAGPAFEVTFQESSLTELDELTDGGQAGEYTFEVPITESGLANILMAVDVARNGATASADSIEVEALGPDGLEATCSFSLAAGAGTSGSCEAEAEVQEAPDMQTINAETAEAAADEGAEALTDAGVGTWNVTVTITAGQALPGPGSPSYTVGLTPGYTLWEANATPPTPGGSGGP